jgi:hypothetical protein
LQTLRIAGDRECEGDEREELWHSLIDIDPNGSEGCVILRTALATIRVRRLEWKRRAQGRFAFFGG